MVFGFFSGRIGMGRLAGDVVWAEWERVKKEKEKKREEVQDMGFKTVLVMRRKQMICLFSQDL